MSGKDYVKIGNAFSRAVEGYEVNVSFGTAIRVMQKKPHLAENIRAWDEMLWLCVQEFLNGLTRPMPEESQEHFEHACAILESNELTEADRRIARRRTHERCIAPQYKI